MVGMRYEDAESKEGFVRCFLSPVRRFKLPFLAFEMASLDAILRRQDSQFSNGLQHGFGSRQLAVV